MMEGMNLKRAFNQSVKWLSQEYSTFHADDIHSLQSGLIFRENWSGSKPLSQRNYVT